MKTKMFKLVLIVVACLFLCIGCGSEQTTKVIATKAITVYINSYLSDIEAESVHAILNDQKEELATRALSKFMEEPTIQDLATKDKVKQAVLLAAADLTNNQQ